MSAADEIVLAIRLARANGKPESEVREVARRMASQYSTAELKGAEAQLTAELEGGR
ncbi:hypothetical protein [Streptomyces sp. NPDC001492]